MRTFLVLLASVLAAVPAAAQGPPAPAAAVIADYLKLPMPGGDEFGEFRTERLRALDRLQQSPDDVPAAIAKALPTIPDARRREELIEALRHFPTRAAADVCVAALADESHEVRGQAIQRLRLFARRAERSGPARDLRGPPARRPQVEGLLPHLIKAADDPHPANRTFAFYALADTLEPAAASRLRGGLKDVDADVRFNAAALLSEFDDASALPELKAQLARLLEAKRNQDGMRFLTTGRLVASFERLTGKSFGRAPMNPMLSSDSRQAPKLEAEHDRLLEAWAGWWAWEPGKQAR
jgi:HEAT repeat protein